MAPKPNALVYYGPANALAPPCGERESLIQRCAYFKASKRHFAPGHEISDWLAAEAEVNERFKRPKKDRDPA